jgi:hypothetical protein
MTTSYSTRPNTTTTTTTTTTTIPFTTVPTTTIPTGISTTTTRSSSNISYSSNSNLNMDYENLVNEIKNTIEKNNTLFQQIQQSNYPNAGNYQSDLINYKIDVKVNDLKNTRQEIWDFINKKYNENTKLKKFYFDEIRKADEFLKIQMNDLQELQKQLTISESKDSSTNEKIKQNKYELYSHEYYKKLYIILMIIQVCILILLCLSYLQVLPVGTSLIISLIVISLTLLYVIYYVFYNNIGRSKKSWYKKEHDNNDISTVLVPIRQMSVSNLPSDKNNIDSKINNIVELQKETSVTCT